MSSHFKNQVVELLASSLGAKHKFYMQYLPWLNGTVESVCRQVLRIVRAFCGEFRFLKLIGQRLFQPFRVLSTIPRQSDLEVGLQSLFVLGWSQVVQSIWL